MSRDNTQDHIDQLLKEMELEHDQLFQSVDRIKESIGAEDMDEAKRRLIQLQGFQQAHFEHEVALMEQYEYPDIDDHKNTHVELIDALHSINRLIILENPRRLDVDLADYLENSLKHVIEVDRPFQEFLSASRDRDA